MADTRQDIGAKLGAALQAIKSRAVAAFLAARPNPEARLSEAEQAVLLKTVWAAIEAALVPVSPTGTVSIGTILDAHGDPQLTLDASMRGPLPVAAYQFHRGATLGLVDVTGNGHALAVDSGRGASGGTEAYLANAVDGVAFDFGGVHRLKSPGSASLRIVGDVTVEMVVQLADVDDGHAQHLLSFAEHAPEGTGAGDLHKYNVLYEIGAYHSATAGKANLWWNQRHGALVDDSVTFADAAPIGALVHVAVVRRSNAIQLYVDGVPFGSPVQKTILPDGGEESSLYLGHHPNLGGPSETWVPFAGLMDYVAIYDVPLSDSEVSLRAQRAHDTWSETSGGGSTSAHASTHVTGGSDVIASAVAGGNAGLMTGADKSKLDGISVGATVGADWNSNVANKPTAFPPSAHAASHGAGQADALSVTESLLSLSDVTTGDADNTRHGLMPKCPSPYDTTRFLRGDKSWSVPPSAGSPSRPSYSGCAIYWDIPSGLPYANIGSAGALNLALYSNAVVVPRRGVFGTCAGLRTLSSDNKGFLRTVSTTVGESASLTVALWLRLSRRTDFAIICAKNYNLNDAAGSPYYAWALRFNSATAANGAGWLFEVNTSGTERFLDMAVPLDFIPYNVWCHLGLTYDAATGVLAAYKDGSAIMSQTITPAAISYGTHGSYVVGADYQYQTRDWEGLIEDIRIMGSALSAADMLALYTAGLRAA